MTKKNNKNKSRGGFTIVELVIALSLIVIVSAAVTSMIASDNRVYTQSINTIEATNVAENAIECFRFAEKTGGDFEELFNNVYAYKVVEDGVEKTLYTAELAEAADGYTLEYHGINFTFKIEGNKITITAEDSYGAILGEDGISYTVR